MVGSATEVCLIPELTLLENSMSELRELTASELDLIAGGNYDTQTNTATQSSTQTANYNYDSEIAQVSVQQIAQANADNYSYAWAKNSADVYVSV